MEFLQVTMAVTFLILLLPTSSFTKSYTCGKTIGMKIIKGESVQRGDYPWMALLVAASDYSAVECGATLITRRFALTAFHCASRSPSDHRLMVGSTDLKTRDSDVAFLKIFQFIKYDTENHKQDDDIALVELYRKIKLGQYVQPICLPPPNMNFEGVEAVVAGFGETNAGYDDTGISEYSNVLLAGDVTVTSTDNCNNVMARYQRPIGDGLLCAGSYGGQPDHCYGDSGGPLMYYDDDSGSWWLIGIVSSAYKCANPKDYSFYVNVTHFHDWIVSYSDYDE